MTICPLCKTEPKIGYACGDYFIYCSEECNAPMCDHPSKESTIKEWEEFAKRTQG